MTQAKWVVLAAALVLTGCGAAPLTIKASFEGEKRLTMAKKGTATAKAAPAAKATPAPLRSPAATAAAPAEAPAADEPAEAATLKLLTGPTTQLLAMPFRAPDGEAVDMMANPKDGMARFEVQAPATGIALTGARIEVSGGDKAASVDQTVKQLEWPARLAYRTALAVPYALYETLEVLSLAPDAKRLTVKATLLGADGAELNGEDGRPLVLEAQVDVL